MGSYLMHTNQLQEFNITTGGIVAKMTLNAIKHRYEKHGQSELAWYYLMKIIMLSQNLIELFITLRRKSIQVKHSIHISTHSSKQLLALKITIKITNKTQ